MDSVQAISALSATNMLKPNRIFHSIKLIVILNISCVEEGCFDLFSFETNLWWKLKDELSGIHSYSWDPRLVFSDAISKNCFFLDIVEGYAVKEDSGKYSCKLCNYIARDKYNVRLHLERKHGLSAGYQCEICHTWVQNKQRLSQHRVQCVKNNQRF